MTVKQLCDSLPWVKRHFSHYLWHYTESHLDKLEPGGFIFFTGIKKPTNMVGRSSCDYSKERIVNFFELAPGAGFSNFELINTASSGACWDEDDSKLGIGVTGTNKATCLCQISASMFAHNYKSIDSLALDLRQWNVVLDPKKGIVDPPHPATNYIANPAVRAAIQKL